MCAGNTDSATDVACAEGTRLIDEAATTAWVRGGLGAPFQTTCCVADDSGCEETNTAQVALGAARSPSCTA